MPDWQEANQEAKFVLFSHDPRNRDITEVICDQVSSIHALELAA